ncbi:1631_t:CDS:2 [Ambispora gerdemannii]|uniref:1631_t:CDS:1 n=1 Tax=Ambispora gerdemannii TaxID=144530 RepID=A0A9N8WAC7_9GLOM|nr:1631_t:CDS:2 [Ambispora gerdemannii]
MSQTITISPRISLSSSSIKSYEQTSPKERVSIHTREPPVTRSIVPIKAECQESKVQHNLSRFNSSTMMNPGLHRYISPKNRNKLARYNSSDSKVSLTEKRGSLIFTNFFDRLRQEEKKVNLEIKRRSETLITKSISPLIGPSKHNSYSGRTNVSFC